MGRSLLQRVVWHALKSLVRKHPGAAFDAAKSGVVYAAKDVAQQGVDKVRDIRDSVIEQKAAPPVTILPEDIDRLAEDLGKEERAALAEFVRKSGSNSRPG